jgi:hypothetical protein
MKIFLQDDCFAHCEFSNNPLPVKQRTDKVIWDRSDNYTEEDIVVWTDRKIPNAIDRKGPNIAWLIEAMPYHQGYYNFVHENRDKFDQIWTHDKQMLDNCDNAKFLPLGGCWIDEFDWAMHNKTKDFSIIASMHKYLPGHKIRHQIVAGTEGKVDRWGSGYQAMDDKIEGLKDYRYTFCIENFRKDFWFTEKLIDCFVTGTLPIYWGCPSIGNLFNLDGMLCFEELQELPKLLKGCTPEYYESKKDALKENFELAKQYRLAELKIPDYIYEGNKIFS